VYAFCYHHAMEKTCRTCGAVKPYSEFYRQKRRSETQASGWSGACRECAKKRMNERLHAFTPEQRQARNAPIRFYKYGITPKDAERMFAEQGGVCAICGERAAARLKPGLKTPIAVDGLTVDHCHASGVVRGLLCKPCNIAVGCMKDNAEWIRKMADYIETRTPVMKV